MSWNRSVRQTHRWVSVAFTVIVVSIYCALALGQPAEWVYYLPLGPLGVLFLTGLYLFVLPYLARRRRGPTRAKET